MNQSEIIFTQVDVIGTKEEEAEKYRIKMEKKK